MCDLGFILLRILQPWNSKSAFTEACLAEENKDAADDLIETLTAESRCFFARNKAESLFMKTKTNE
jgi:hypothetical protein